MTTRAFIKHNVQMIPRTAVQGWRGFVRRLPRTIAGRLVLTVAVLVSLLFLVLFSLLLVSRMTPGYWKSNERLLTSDNATLMQLANQFEQQTLRELSSSQDEPATTTRTIHLSFEQINAWLSIKLEDFLANRKLTLPASIRHPMLAGDDGYLIIAFEYHTDQLNQVISLRLKPVFDSTGKRFRLQLLGAEAGVLPLPVDTLRNRLSAQSPQVKKNVDKVFDMLGNQWLEAAQRHPGDARQNLRLTAIHITPQGLDLTIHSEPREPHPDSSPPPAR